VARIEAIHHPLDEIFWGLVEVQTLGRLILKKKKKKRKKKKFKRLGD